MAYTVIETLTDEQKTETRNRKKAICKIYDLLNKELDNRDLSDIPTDKLIHLISMLSKQMDNQSVLLNERKYQTGL